ncbi:MAG: tyrosine-type recombinase/integrase [Chloroflexi bacterium]|nr:tyrosine-type recombinase/integrase [Chloroflexota bacterium]
MAKKRGYGEGTVTQRRDGRWTAALTLPNGKRKWLYASTQSEVIEKLESLKRSLRDGRDVSAVELTVAKFSQQWLAAVKQSIRPKTYTTYSQLLRTHIIPEYGNVKVTRLLAAHPLALYEKMLKAGKSPSTVLHVHRVASMMMSAALQWNLVNRNILKAIKPPSVPHREMQILSADEARQLLTAAVGDRLEALYWLALVCGPRAGEMLALQWKNVNLDAGTLRITATLHRRNGDYHLDEPKTKKSRRTLNLPPMLISKLRQHRVTQNEEIRSSARGAWQHNEFVFSNTIGNPLDITNLLRRQLRPLLRKAGVRRSVTIQELRHSAVSFALSRGVAPIDVAQMAGHSSVAVTLTRYAHALPGATLRASEAIEAVMLESLTTTLTTMPARPNEAVRAIT